jgi:hypothetical protein
MKRSWKLLLAGLLTVATPAAPAWACGSSCHRGGGRANPVRPTPVNPVDNTPPTPNPNGLAGNGIDPNDLVIDDLLPADAKRAIHLAAHKAGSVATTRTTTPRRPTTQPPVRVTTPEPTTDRPLAFNERMAELIAAQQELATENARLEVKLNELTRWDDAAQEKFVRAFGTTDQAVRQRIMKLIEQKMEQNRQTAATLAEGANLQFYLQTKRR